MDSNKSAAFAAAIAAQLRAERAAAGLTIEDLSALSGASRSSVFRYLSGARDIGVGSLFAITQAMGLSVAEFTRRAEDRIASQQ